MKRYDVTESGEIEPRADGYWVKFEDYEADRAALVEQLAAEQRMRKDAQKRLGHAINAIVNAPQGLAPAAVLARVTEVLRG